MYSNVGDNMVALDRGSAAGIPSTDETQAVGALSADMLLANVLLEIKLALLNHL